jgi:hypothetical protein
MNIEANKAKSGVPDFVSEVGINLGVIQWTRQANGSYQRVGQLPDEASTVRIFVSEELQSACSGQKLWPKVEAVALVERKIAEGSYRAWRYEIRPEMPKAGDPVAPVSAALTKRTEARTCANVHCKKGPDGTAGAVARRNAKYCCSSCRVSTCRRNRPKPERTEKSWRKPRSDKKYASQADRQRAYDHRKWGAVRARRAIDREYGIRTWPKR